jgi:hypothetical protein
MVRRAKKTSRASSIDGLATKAPRFGTSVISPSRESCCSTWRIRARLTANIPASCSSLSLAGFVHIVLPMRPALVLDSGEAVNGGIKPPTDLAAANQAIFCSDFC